MLNIIFVVIYLLLHLRGCLCSVPLQSQSLCVAVVWHTFYILAKNLYFEFVLGRPLGGYCEAGLTLETLPKNIAFTPINLSPIGCT